MRKFSLTIGLLAVLAACQPKPEEGIPVARVMDDYLYLSDLEGVVTPGTLQTDSLAAVQAYIHNWIQQKLLINKAKRNLPDLQKEKAFEQEIENYRNSLIIFSFQNALIGQAVDTVVTETDIENYYQENKQQFLLKSNIVRVRFVKLENIPHDTKDKTQKAKLAENESIYTLIFANELSDADWVKLSELSQKNSTNFYLDGESWVYFNDLLKEVPADAYNQEDFLRRNQKFQVPDEDYVYYVNILEFRLKEDYSPMDFEREKIRNTILNNRKIKLIENLRNEVMVEGQERNWFEIY